MPTNRNIIEMVETIRNGKNGNSALGGVDSIYLADVVSVEPLAIKLHDTLITKNLYINPALLLEASDDEGKIKEIFRIPFETREAYEFLKQFHEKFVLKKGDTVVVCMTGSSFYIAGKAVSI